jgi:hypothetical protein
MEERSDIIIKNEKFQFLNQLTVQNDHLLLCTVLRVSKRHFCVTANVMISSYAVSRPRDWLRFFLFCLRLSLFDHVLGVPQQKVVKGREICNLGVQACGPKWVRGTRDLPEVGVSVKVVHKNWCRTVTWNIKMVVVKQLLISGHCWYRLFYGKRLISDNNILNFVVPYVEA